MQRQSRDETATPSARLANTRHWFDVSDKCVERNSAPPSDIARGSQGIGDVWQKRHPSVLPHPAEPVNRTNGPDLMFAGTSGPWRAYLEHKGETDNEKDQNCSHADALIAAPVGEKTNRQRGREGGGFAGKGK